MPFPSSVDSFAGFVSTDTLAQDNHASQHNSEQAAIVAIENKMGTGASTPTSGVFLRGNGVGTSAWSSVNAATDLSGVLPQSNGGTGTTSATGTGSAVYQTSPSITTPTVSGGTFSGNPNFTGQPTVADFTNSQHNHQNAAGGGVLTAQALPALDLSKQSLYIPYKFSVFRSAGLNSSSTLTVVAHDTRAYDTSSNVDITVNKGRFTAPVAGFYMFSARAGNTAATNTAMASALFKNGSTTGGITGVQVDPSQVAGGENSTMVTGVLQLAAGDYVEHAFIGGNGSVMSVGQLVCWFHGILLCTT